jgi:ATP-dependent RNA helicase SUPV3L1/SUV3
MVDASRITALLGPTNTGKTHHAIERMLEHPTGMIGLPLRLLAREVYDKISALVGENAVALVTGEEKRVPPRPSYWVSTVEAMPVERDVDFVAVDEVQLAAHPERGHVFTSRILSARGRKETWFLGSASMRGVLGELTPTAQLVEHPRLSRLSFAGGAPLSRVPPRSAIVAFSASHVYELAERIRSRRGGAAVVLGALSPRTRNAQVAMFQAGEVDHLVATDAIGMGLNLNVAHVAFASLRKFDGHDARPLDETELGQIAGRAGRWIENGTFGTLEPVTLPDDVARSIEDHRFSTIRRVRWRNDALAFDGIAALKESLAARPSRPLFRSVEDAEDRRALLLLEERAEVVRAARSEEAVRLLWDVCKIPDFRKLLFEAHVEFLAELFLELARGERLSDDWIAARVRGLDDTSGDVESLVARIAAIRTWAYVSSKPAWLKSPEEWAELTRELEDRLSDALHARLVMRFVDVKKSRSRAPSPKAAHKPRPQEKEPVAVSKGHPFAALAQWRARPAVESAPVDPGPAQFVEDVIAAAHDALELQAGGRIVHRASARTVGEIARGTGLALPDVRLQLADEAGSGTRSRVQRRLVAFARDVVGDLLGGLRPLGKREGSAALRGLLHRLEQTLGTVLASDVADALSGLEERERAALTEAGLVMGRRIVYVAGGLAPSAIETRIALATAFFGRHAGRAVTPPSKSAVSFPARRDVEPAIFLSIGHPVFGRRAVRADVAERIAAELMGAEVIPEKAVLAQRLGCPMRDIEPVLSALVSNN